MGHWIYKIDMEDRVEPVSAARYQRFYDNPDSREFTECAGRHVRFVIHPLRQSWNK